MNHYEGDVRLRVLFATDEDPAETLAAIAVNCQVALNDSLPRDEETGEIDEAQALTDAEEIVIEAESAGRLVKL